MVFQEQSLLTNLTVGENIYLGNEAQFTRFGIVDWRALYAAAARQLAKVQVDVDPRMRAEDLDFASRQMVELAKALTLEEHAGGHLVILLDEPTSVLERAEIEILFARVRALKSRASFIFVSHRLDEVLELSDRIYVMKDGAVVADLKAGDADVTKLHHLMVGRSLQAEYYREPLQKPFRDEVADRGRRPVARPGLQGRELQAARRRDPRHCRRHRLGPRGADAHACRLCARTTAAGSSSAAARCGCNTPAEAVDLGIGYIPRERRVEGLVLFLPVAANITLADLGSLSTARPDRRARGAPAGDELGRAPEGAHARHRHALPQPLRRQPAEGRAGEMAERQGEGADPRSPDARPRRRRQGGGLRAGARGHRGGRRGHPDLRHAGGDHRAQPHRAGDARRRDHPPDAANPGRTSRGRSISSDTWSEARSIDRLGADRLRQWLPLATLVVLVALVGTIQPVFLQPATLLQLASDTAVLFILATGVTFVIMLGGIDLSIQSMASLASVIVALTVARLGYGAFALAVAVGALAGLLSGLAHVRLKIPSFIATLAMGGVLFSTALVISERALDHAGGRRARLPDLDHRHACSASRTSSSSG